METQDMRIRLSPTDLTLEINCSTDTLRNKLQYWTARHVVLAEKFFHVIAVVYCCICVCCA